MRMCDFAHILDGTIALAGARGIRYDATTRKRFSLRRVVVRWVKWVMGRARYMHEVQPAFVFCDRYVCARDVMRGTSQSSAVQRGAGVSESAV
jgi:hypothetical protein